MPDFGLVLHLLHMHDCNPYPSPPASLPATPQVTCSHMDRHDTPWHTLTRMQIWRPQQCQVKQASRQPDSVTFQF